MKALIAGSGGQLGRALQATAPPGVDVIAPPEADFDILADGAAAEWLARTGASVLFNAAAYTAVDKAEADLERARAINADAAGSLAAASHAAGARFVHVSTDFVFDGTRSTPYTPDAVPAPLGAYGRTKLDGELAVLGAHSNALIVRTAWVYAARGGNFVHTMLRVMRERPDVRVVADQIGTPTHAAGLARALWALNAAGETGVHHWTDAGACSWYDFAVAIQEEALAAGLLDRAVPVIPIRTQDYPTPARRPAYSVLDKTSAWAVTGPAPHWRQELRACIAAMKDDA